MIIRNVAYDKILDSSFIDLIDDFEGICTWMYLDEKCLVTTGIGNLIEPISLARDLVFEIPGERIATWDEVVDEWNLVNSMTEQARYGGGTFKKFTKLRLTKESFRNLVQGKVDEMESRLAARFADFESEWCCDAQIGLLSMSWAGGPAFRAPRFSAYANALDFWGCARECALHTARDGVDKILFQNAAIVNEEGLDRDVLYFPRDLYKERDEQVKRENGIVAQAPIPVELPGIPRVLPDPF